MTEAFERLELMLKDVDHLITFHSNRDRLDLAVVQRDTKREAPLLRSCVVLTYAAWEVYVEDSAIWAAQQIANVSKADSVPASLQSCAASWASTNPWLLSGEGWRDAIVNAVTELTRGEDGKSFGMNSAGPQQIAKLHREVFGDELLRQCSWQGKPNDSVRKDLAQLVRVRGAIVHTGQTPGPLDLDGAIAWHDFVGRVCSRLDRSIEAWVSAQLNNN